MESFEDLSSGDLKSNKDRALIVMTDQKQIIFREIDSLKQALPVSDAILEQQVGSPRK